ncbi:MAG: hypothetical protein ACK41P_08115 [Asticcacaulis sp.]
MAQIFSGQVPEWLGIGRSVSEQSAATSHPLVPLGPAFAIWGVIYLWALVAAAWAILNPRNAIVRLVGPHMAVIWALNTAWSIWVPINGIEWVSLGIICISLLSGLTGLYRLRSLELSRAEAGFFIVPLALVTGWITAASVVNLTSALVASGLQPDPRQVMVSLAFLIGLIVFAGMMLRMTLSRIYAIPLVWALGWIAAANMQRQDEPLMVYTALAGIGLLLILLFTLKGQSKGRLPG